MYYTEQMGQIKTKKFLLCHRKRHEYVKVSH